MGAKTTDCPSGVVYPIIHLGSGSKLNREIVKSLLMFSADFLYFLNISNNGVCCVISVYFVTIYLNKDEQVSTLSCLIHA